MTDKMGPLHHTQLVISSKRHSGVNALKMLSALLLTFGLARAVPCVTIAGLSAVRTAAGAPWWSCGQRGHRTACRRPALCERHRCWLACLGRTLLLCRMMGRKGRSGGT